MANASFSATLTITALESAGDGAPRKSVVLTDPSTDRVVTYSMRNQAGGLVEERVVLQFQSQGDVAGDCAWNPGKTVVPPDPTPGAKWSYAVSCTETTGFGPVERTEEGVGEVVRADGLAIGAERLPVLVLKRTTTTRSRGSEEHAEIEDWYAPSLGFVVKQAVHTAIPGAPAFASESSTEWSVVGHVEDH